MQAFRTIRYERSGHVGRLTLARPEKRNAQNPLMWQELGLLGDELVSDETLRCLTVAGEGASFSAGIDLVEGLGGVVAEWTERPEGRRTLQDGASAAGTFRWIPRLGCPSVAAVHGHAYGAGLQLALACDLRVFARSARVGLTETRYGILPDMGATVRLPRIVGDGHARRLILLGEVIDSAEALRMSLANYVVDDEDLESAVQELAARLSSQPPLALRGARRAIDMAWHPDSDHAFGVAVEEQIRCLLSEDFREARRAMTEGRQPQWTGS
jgi:enoyl-CoA hydratase/carnithine racemase